jgi:hypothetical protein
MEIKNAKYIIDVLYNKIDTIKATIDNFTIYVPINPANKHYSEIMRQVEAGTLVIQPADEPETP